MISKKSLLLSSALFLALPMSALLPGCGGGSSNGSSNSQGQTFTSSFALAPGQTALLTINVKSGDTQSGLASGTLVVPSRSAQNKSAQAFSFAVPAGSYPLFGSFTEPNAFSVSGRFPNIGSFVISGQIPVGTTSSTYTVTAKGETATGTFISPNATATPTASATATAVNQDTGVI